VCAPPTTLLLALDNTACKNWPHLEKGKKGYLAIRLVGTTLYIEGISPDRKSFQTHVELTPFSTTLFLELIHIECLHSSIMIRYAYMLTRNHMWGRTGTLTISTHSTRWGWARDQWGCMYVWHCLSPPTSIRGYAYLRLKIRGEGHNDPASDPTHRQAVPYQPAIAVELPKYCFPISLQ